MHQMASTAMNIHHLVRGDEVETMIEAVITTVEKHHEFMGPDLVPIEKCNTERFYMTIAGAEGLQKILSKWIEAAKAERSRLTVKKVGE